MKVKRANRLMSIIDEIWVINLQKVDTLLMIGNKDKYFHFIPVIMVLYIYKYWFPPLIKARASSTNCTMGNLTCSRHATYLHVHTIYLLNLARFISFQLYKSLISAKTKEVKLSHKHLFLLIYGLFTSNVHVLFAQKYIIIFFSVQLVPHLTYILISMYAKTFQPSYPLDNKCNLLEQIL